MPDAQVANPALNDDEETAAGNGATAPAPNFKALLDVLAALEAEFGETIQRHAARPE